MAKKWPVFLAVEGQSRGSAKKWALFLANAIYTDKEGGFSREKSPSFLHHAPSDDGAFYLEFLEVDCTVELAAVEC